MAEIVWRTQAEIEAEREARAWASLRAERDRLLVLSDWTQLPDAPLTEEQRQAWAAYRQALRDLPQTCETPCDVEWPAPPEE